MVKCAVCTLSLTGEDGMMEAVSLCASPRNCGHTFHHQCLLNSLNNYMHCPKCRSRCSLNSIRRIYLDDDDDDDSADTGLTVQQIMEQLQASIQADQGVVDIQEMEVGHEEIVYIGEVQQQPEQLVAAQQLEQQIDHGGVAEQPIVAEAPVQASFHLNAFSAMRMRGLSPTRELEQVRQNHQKHQEKIRNGRIGKKGKKKNKTGSQKKKARLTKLLGQLNIN